jgi:hypothetical protein
MLSLSQYLIVGLVGSIYVAGTAFLLTGRSFLKGNGPSRDGVEKYLESPELIEDAPYFFPVLEECTLKHIDKQVDPVGAYSPATGEHAETSCGDPSSDRGASETKELVLLTTPICLN